MRAVLLALAIASIVTAVANAQGQDSSVVAAPAEPDAILLGTGPVDGNGSPESWFKTGSQLSVRNVQQASLTPVLPDQSKATGAAVIVAPGGAFLMLSMDSEGWSIARWLADRGIAAFVLKYRLRQTGPTMDSFRAEFGKVFGARRMDREGPPPTPAYAVEDAAAALQLVQKRAKEWGVDPKRIGMMGFSAGAMTTLTVALKATPESMPAFIAPIYGPLQAVEVPSSAPPMYVVIAADDGLFANADFGLIQSWRKAKKPVEFHLYQSGGHGFGIGKANTTTADWLEGFHRWMEVNKWLKANPAPTGASAH